MKDRAFIITMVSFIVVILGFASTRIQWPVHHDHVAVANLAAPASVDAIRAAFEKIPGVSGVAVDKNGKTVYVGFISAQISADSLKKLIISSGYSAGEPLLLTAQSFRNKTGSYFNPNCADCMSGCGR